MSPSVLPVLLVGALVISAVTAPRLIRMAAPALAPRPRLAVGLLAGGVLAWLLSFMALGPLFAWMTTAKRGADSAGFCRKCLESSNPWATPVFDTGIPTTIVMAGPALLVGIGLATLVARVIAGEIDAGRDAARIRRRARPELIRGHRVLVLDDPRAEAFALSSRHGGIVLSTGTFEALDPDQLDAVLAHEQAHLSQRHHLIAAISRHATQVFRPIPALHAAAAAIPLYLEIAADNAARDQIGTRALVSALLRLDTHRRTADRASIVGVAALHATGPDRFRTLVCAPSSTGGRATAIATSLQSAVLVALTAAVALPWLAAMTSGCA
ncbi:M56 family metallopeptidase [Gordonia hydrophobica]|uniref:M56 family metallopeptidase n=1 Tax=Gordonia hydrophobica TaxID=40516 RepID=A0ABZ2U9G4_9ACTN|nr:M56 family metallopeptidase [Gordonia hydrophobica]MBM7365428.1 Zn-dependent protease with chaperone function [Gordonia hydrophobica]